MFLYSLKLGLNIKFYVALKSHKLLTQIQPDSLMPDNAKGIPTF